MGENKRIRQLLDCYWEEQKIPFGDVQFVDLEVDTDNFRKS